MSQRSTIRFFRFFFLNTREWRRQKKKRNKIQILRGIRHAGFYNKLSSSVRIICPRFIRIFYVSDLEWTSRFPRHEWPHVCAAAALFRVTREFGPDRADGCVIIRVRDSTRSRLFFFFAFLWLHCVARTQDKSVPRSTVKLIVYRIYFCVSLHFFGRS